MFGRKAKPHKRNMLSESSTTLLTIITVKLFDNASNIVDISKCLAQPGQTWGNMILFKAQTKYKFPKIYLKRPRQLI